MYLSLFKDDDDDDYSLSWLIDWRCAEKFLFLLFSLIAKQMFHLTILLRVCFLYIFFIPLSVGFTPINVTINDF